MSTKRSTIADLRKIYDEDITFGNALRAERESREMSRSEFCELLDISIQSLADLEHGRRIPSPERAVKIAKQIKEPVAYWVQLSFQDELNEKDINLKVTVA